MNYLQNRNALIGGLVAVVAVLSALVVVTSIAQMYALSVTLMIVEVVVLAVAGHMYMKAREQRQDMFCANLTVNK